MKNLVIGISGGLDSTLALLVCAEAKKLSAGRPESRYRITLPERRLAYAERCIGDALAQRPVRRQPETEAGSLCEHWKQTIGSY